MSSTEDTILTHHAMLVAWGQYAHCIGLIREIDTARLRQKTVKHRPQTKVLEFLVAILGGFPYLKDISFSAHPLDKDQTVAQAWGQPGWADHSGVSRTLRQLSDEEVSQISAILDRVSQPMIDREVVLASGAGRLELDGDLSPRPVSSTSTTYPGASFGHMSDGVGLGYQAAILSMKSPTYGRIGLSAAQHPGSTVAASQAEALALAAEGRIGRWPLRRTDLLAQRIQGLLVKHEQLDQKATRAQQRLAQAETDLVTVEHSVNKAQQQLHALQTEYERRQRPERPYSKLAKARKRLGVYQRRLTRRQQDVSKAQAWLARQKARLVTSQDEITRLQKRLHRFQEDNIANVAPIRAVFRLDAGFGTPENIALLIEMGYEVYSKPHGTWLSGWLAERSAELDDWQRVGKNAEMVAWNQVPLDDFPYPLDLARQRFWTGQVYRYSGLLHFGQDDVTADLPGWFHYYNARQCIEAGNKEVRQVFEVHHLKVRAPAALQLQERFALFAANFVRFAAHWLSEQCPQIPDGWKESSQPRVKEQVKVGANTSAWVRWLGQDCLLTFEDRSVYAGRSLTVKRLWAFQPVLPFTKSYFFSSI
jgi:hypothetical protein